MAHVFVLNPRTLACDACGRAPADPVHDPLRMPEADTPPTVHVLGPAAPLDPRMVVPRAITTLNPGEAVLLERTVAGTHIQQLPPDPQALRVSCGAPYATGDPLRYCVIRGDLPAALACLRATVTSLEALLAAGA